MSRTAIVTVAAFIYAVSIVSHIEGNFVRSDVSTGLLKGTVMDSNEAILAGAKLIIKGETFERQVMSDHVGMYKLELPAGIYQISANLAGFFPFRRAPFRVRAGRVTLINIIPMPGPASDGDWGLNEKERNVKSHQNEDAPFRYESLNRKSPLPSALSILVRFEERRVQSDIIEYCRAMLTYDAIAVYADKIRLQRDVSQVQVKAEGNVFVEDGRNRIYVKEATIIFGPGEPSIQLVRGAISSVSGTGSIEDGIAKFDFNAGRRHTGYVTYTDNEKHITFVSSSIDFFRVVEDTPPRVEFGGGGTINDIQPVSFIVTVRVSHSTTSENDLFGINFLVSGLSRNGPLSSGRIEIHREE